MLETHVTFFFFFFLKKRQNALSRNSTKTDGISLLFQVLEVIPYQLRHFDPQLLAIFIKKNITLFEQMSAKPLQNLKICLISDIGYKGSMQFILQIGITQHV